MSELKGLTQVYVKVKIVGGVRAQVCQQRRLPRTKFADKKDFLDVFSVKERRQTLFMYCKSAEILNVGVTAPYTTQPYMVISLLVCCITVVLWINGNIPRCNLSNSAKFQLCQACLSTLKFFATFILFLILFWKKQTSISLISLLGVPPKTKVKY